MKIIIPAKSNSTRVPNKNFREFYKGKSITDILLDKLSFLNYSDIYLSSDDPSKESICQKYGCNFLLRDKRLCDNDTPLNDFVQGICEQVEGQDDIAWCQVIDPLFNDYETVFKTWEECKNDFDSLVVLYPVKKYLLNSMHLPMNFGFGHWHVKSQNLPEFYEMTFTLSILKREWIKKCGYHIGSKPKWFYAKNNHIDIDTMEEFELAQLIYSHQNK